MTQQTTPPFALSELSSAALTHRLGELFDQERRCLVDFLWHLGEMDRRHGFLELGYPSSFAWCTGALNLQPGSAWRRIASARLLLRFPIIDSYLREKRLCMTTLVPLREVLDEENHRDLLERAAGKSEDDVKVLVATLRPRPEVRDSIRPVKTRAVVVTDAPSLFASSPKPPEDVPTAPADDSTSGRERNVDTPVLPVAETEAPASGRERTVNTPVVLVPLPPPPPRIEPIDAQRHSIRFTAGPEFMGLLAEAKSVLSHVVPDGNLEALLAHCLRKTLEEAARRQRGAVERPRAEVEPKPQSSEPLKKPWSRYVSAAVRRAVWNRDGGRCTFVGPDGTRCNSRHQLQLDHLKPFALGGEATEANLTLRCRAHNLHRAREHFGREHMAKFIGRRRSPASECVKVPDGTAPPPPPK